MPAWLLAAAIAPTPPAAPCGLARVVRRDIAATGDEPAGSCYLNDRAISAAVPSVFPLCPDLLRHPPTGWRAAGPGLGTALDFPRPGEAPHRGAIFLWSVGRPTFTPDGREATVPFAMRCIGLCGHGGTWRYRRTRTGWRNLGTTGPMWVS